MFHNEDILFNPDELWNEMSVALEDICDKKHISKDRCARIYNHVGQYCYGIAGSFPEDNQDKLMEDFLEDFGVLVENFNGYGLYLKIVSFFTKFLEYQKEVTNDLTDEQTFDYYQKKWEPYQFQSKLISNLCFYLNRIWIPWYSGPVRRQVFKITFLALNSWKNIFFRPVASRLTNVMLKMIDRERRGEIINTVHLRSVISSYVEVGTDESHPPDVTFTLILYKEEFERDFLRETELFYTKESEEFLNQNPISDYIKMVEQRFNEETQRVKLYLHSSTLEPLSRILEQILILSKKDIYFQEMKNLLALRKNEDIARLHKLIVRIPNNKMELEKILEAFLYQQGLAAVNKCSESAQDPRTYVNMILSEYHKSHKLMMDVFNKKVYFNTALEKAFTRLINTNPTNRNKSPELLARYCDTLLKKSSKQTEEGELEDALNEIMIVFKFIDKDVFQKFYAKFLAKRLVTQSSVSEDSEATMISKLKHDCGYEYTCKLQRMFRDMEMSKILMETYKRRLLEFPKFRVFDFQVQILSSGSWPFAISETFSLPSEMEKSLHRFSRFYSTRENGRKLHWLYNLSKGELQTNCFKHRYTLQVSTYQMAILLQYNECTSLTLQQLYDSTKIKMDSIIQVVQVLLKVKLLTSTDEESKLQPLSVVELFAGYKNERLKVNINVPMKSEVEAEVKKTNRNIEED